MKINEIKKQVEQVVRTEYIAVDGTVFYIKEECEKYEKTALCVVKSKLKRLAETTVYNILEEGSDEDLVEIFDIQTQDDVANLKQYIMLTIMNTGYSGANSCIESVERDQFHKIEAGHEVIINWNYDMDYCYICGNGSIDDYVNSIRNRLIKIITPKEEKKEGEQ